MLILSFYYIFILYLLFLSGILFHILCNVLYLLMCYDFYAICNFVLPFNSYMFNYDFIYVLFSVFLIFSIY